MSAIFDRQNDDTALTYLRAAYYCKRQEYSVTYYMVIISVLLTAVSIVIKCIPEVLADWIDAELYDTIATAIVLLSGIVLISNIMFSYLKYTYNVEGVNLLERYDIYVFNLPTNKSLLRPMAEQTIINYARKYKNKKKIAKLKNYYFKTPLAAEDKKACIMNIKQQFAYSHRLMINVRTFFMFIWVLFPVALITAAFVLDRKFTDTVIDIFIPSLSAISLIASAWISFNEQLKRLNNAINVINEMLPNGKKDAQASVPLQSPLILRSLQDTLFKNRQREFICPGFLVKRFDRMLAKEQELLNTEILINNPIKSPKKNGATAVKTKPQPPKQAHLATNFSVQKAPQMPKQSTAPQNMPASVKTTAKPTSKKTVSNSASATNNVEAIKNSVTETVQAPASTVTTKKVSGEKSQKMSASNSKTTTTASPTKTASADSQKTSTASKSAAVLKTPRSTDTKTTKKQ